MSKRTYRGSCHCGRVKFEADLDFEKTGTSKCNCTFCFKRRWWSVRAETSDFRPLGDESNLSRFREGQKVGHGGFCKHCGVTPYAWVDAAEWNDGAYVSINVAALDDATPSEMFEGPVTFCDGRADNWWHPPAETRHL